ncbi:hypothetical protein Tco_0932180, partial [Tanacetum coccineum]
MQERLGHEEAIRLQEQINEEERQRIARDAEIAKQLQEEFNRARQEQEVVAEANQARDIDWSAPAMLRYHAPQNRSFFIGFVQKQPAEEEKEKKNDDSQQQVGRKSSKKRSREDSDEDNAKKQKLEDDAEKRELRDSINVVLRDDIAIDVESLSTKYPIVDWKTHVLTESMMYYQIIKADRILKNYKVFSEMLDDFDRQDVMDLYRLVQESTGVAIHMMIEKKYPLTQEMLLRMLSRRLEVDQESEMTFELLRVLYKVVDITTCLLEYVKFWDDLEADRYWNANLGDLDNSTSNILTPLDSWTSGLLVYKLPLS